MNWYKILKLADQFTDLLSPEEATEFGHMNDTIELYQNAIEELQRRGQTIGFIGTEEQDVGNNEFMIKKVRQKIKEFREWVLKNRSERREYSYINKAIEHFGLTDDPNEAGYILPDGTMLDFSGKNTVSQENSSSHMGTRPRDHREINFVLDDFPGGTNRTDGMNAFMRLTGAIRIGYYPHWMFISFKSPMTERQISIIIELGKKRMDKIDIEGPRPSDYKTLRFPTGSQIRKAINELV